MPYVDPLSPFRGSEFTEPVVELERLLSQSGRVFLMGAGCSKCAGLPLMPELTKNVLDALDGNPKPKAILQGLQRNFDGATQCTIEGLHERTRRPRMYRRPPADSRRKDLNGPS